MAHGGAPRPPFVAVVQLWEWATARSHYIDGVFAWRGIDPSTVPARRLLNMVFVLMVGMVGDVNRDQVIEEFESKLIESPYPDRATWGTRPQDRQAVSAMMATYGPSPGWSPPGAEGVTSWR